MSVYLKIKTSTWVIFGGLKREAVFTKLLIGPPSEVYWYHGVRSKNGSLSTAINMGKLRRNTAGTAVTSIFLIINFILLISFGILGGLPGLAELPREFASVFEDTFIITMVMLGIETMMMLVTLFVPFFSHNWVPLKLFIYLAGALVHGIYGIVYNNSHNIYDHFPAEIREQLPPELIEMIKTANLAVTISMAVYYLIIYLLFSFCAPCRPYIALSQKELDMERADQQWKMQQQSPQQIHVTMPGGSPQYGSPGSYHTPQHPQYSTPPPMTPPPPPAYTSVPSAPASVEKGHR